MINSMKKALLYIGIALATIGCAKDDTTDTIPTDGAVNFSAGVTTRVSSGDDCKWATSDDYIGIFTDQTGDSQNMKYEISDAESGEMEKLSGDALYTLTSGKRTYYAYHPYNVAQDAKTTIDFDCTTDQSNYLLWATTTSNDTEVKLQFTHQLPKVTFNLTAGGVDVTSLADAKVWLAGATSKATFDIKTGEFTDLSTDNIDLELDSDYSVTAYLLPSSGVKLWITGMDEKNNTFVRTITDEWESGNSYAYDITVGEEPPSYVEFKRDESNIKNITKSDDSGAIANLLAKFRRCLMTTDDNGNATICYLDNDDSTLYYDGSDADITSGNEGDVMVYFPEYWYKYENVDDDYFRYHFSESEVDGYVHVEESLVGAYKGYVVDGDNDNDIGETFSSDSKLYSRSDVAPTGDVRQDYSINYANNRGTGYQIIDYEQHCTIAMMLYAKYLDRNLQNSSCLGTGGATTTTTTGTTNSKGNADTENESGTGNYVNGLAIEGVFGGIYEWVQGVSISSNVWTITDTNGTRTVKAYSSSSGYITAMAIEGYDSTDGNVGYSNSTTQYFDMVPTEASGGSYSTYYADYYYCNTTGPNVLARSCSSSGTSGGVACSNASNSSSNTLSVYGSRLAFRGTITEAESVAEYKKLFSNK